MASTLSIHGSKAAKHPLSWLRCYYSLLRNDAPSSITAQMGDGWLRSQTSTIMSFILWDMVSRPLQNDSNIISKSFQSHFKTIANSFHNHLNTIQTSYHNQYKSFVRTFHNIIMELTQSQATPQRCPRNASWRTGQGLTQASRPERIRPRPTENFYAFYEKWIDTLSLLDTLKWIQPNMFWGRCAYPAARYHQFMGRCCEEWPDTFRNGQTRSGLRVFSAWPRTLRLKKLIPAWVVFVFFVIR